MNAEMLFLVEFADRLKLEAANQNIELSNEVIAHATRVAASTMREKGIPNSATIDAVVKRYIKNLIEF